ncbi:hypothetical protein PC128_g26399 [Phytophthora cactorum]|nr:hypothetical protein PC128_g26399 [Phytophthora cactorum]
MASEFTSNQEKKKKQEARKMAKRSTTVPATPSKSGGARNESSSPDVAAARLAAVSELSVSFEDEEEHGLDVQDDYDDYEDKTPVPEPGAATPKTVTLSSGLSGATKSLSRSAQTATRTRGLATELDDVAGPDPDYDDFNDGTEGSKPSVASAKRSALLNAPRPPINGDTPAAKRVFDYSPALPHGHVAATKVVDTVPSVRSTPTVNARKMEDAIVTLESTYVSVARVLTTEGNEASDNTRADHYEHPASKIGLEDYAKELAFLPDFTEESNTTIDYGSPNVTDPRLSTDRQERLIATLKTYEHIMIASGNELPLPAYGVVCDINTQGHAPIKQRARRVPLRYLGKLYELLRALLRAGLIVFSDSPWASPIVIMMKKNGQDIRLCIDYKMVNEITAIMEYAMPLVDDLLTDLECYLWFCSLDAASGFWAIMMTLRARKVSAFVCALGHFEWLRMPFGLKNAPMIYQRMIDNALWGFFQPKGGWLKYSEMMRQAEAQAKERSATSNEGSFQTKFEADREASVETDPVLQLVNSPVADMFTTGELDESSVVPVFGRRSFVDDICFGGEDFDSCLATLDRLLTRFAQCRISISFTKSIFCQPKVDFLCNGVTHKWLHVATWLHGGFSNVGVRHTNGYTLQTAGLYAFRLPIGR